MPLCGRPGDVHTDATGEETHPYFYFDHASIEEQIPPRV